MSNSFAAQGATTVVATLQGLSYLIKVWALSHCSPVSELHIYIRSKVLSALRHFHALPLPLRPSLMSEIEP